jgi:hypothetical protein
MDDLALAPTFPAHLQVADRATVAQLVTAVQGRAPVPESVDPARLVFWTAIASTSQLDAYSTYMSTATLRNFAADAKAGVSFQDGHLTDGAARTLGQSLMARYSGPNAEGTEPGIAAVEIDFFGERGLEPGTDATIRKMEIGVLRDVSVGFHLGTDGFYRCVLCNRDMFDYSDWQNACPHIPGMRYPVFDKAGKPTDERVLATAEIVNARLSEVSAVYDGATPGASILAVKARQLSEAGRLDPERARVLEARYRINLPGTARAFAGFTPSKEEPMPTLEEQLRALATEIGVPEGTDILAHVRTLAADNGTRIKAATTQRDGEYRAALAAIGLSCEGDDLPSAIRQHGAALTAQRQLADDGRAYRADLITQVLDEGVRAFGADYERDQEQAELESLPLASIKRRQANYAKVAAKTFPGGRQTTDEGGDGKQGARSQEPVSTAVSTMTADEAARFRTRY